MVNKFKWLNKESLIPRKKLKKHKMGIISVLNKLKDSKSFKEFLMKTKNKIKNGSDILIIY